MRRQCSDKHIKLVLPLRRGTIEHVISNALVNKASEAYSSLALDLQNISLCLCLVHGSERRIKVLGLGRIVYVATHNPARLFCNVLVERHKHFSESILAARCINDPYLPGRTQSHLQHSVRNRTSVRSWDELGTTSGLSNVDVQNFNRRGKSCCTVGENPSERLLKNRPTIEEFLDQATQ
jgi:hypothetical protein